MQPVQISSPDLVDISVGVRHLAETMHRYEVYLHYNLDPYDMALRNVVRVSLDAPHIGGAVADAISAFCGSSIPFTGAPVVVAVHEVTPMSKRFMCVDEEDIVALLEAMLNEAHNRQPDDKHGWNREIREQARFALDKNKNATFRMNALDEKTLLQLQNELNSIFGSINELCHINFTLNHSVTATGTDNYKFGIGINNGSMGLFHSPDEVYWVNLERIFSFDYEEDVSFAQVLCNIRDFIEFRN